jgi:hypothetical protein
MPVPLLALWIELFSGGPLAELDDGTLVGGAEVRYTHF